MQYIKKIVQIKLYLSFKNVKQFIKNHLWIVFPLPLCKNVANSFVYF